MYTELSGPDFLDKVADVEAGNGLDINANEYRKRAAQWRELERQTEASATELARLSSEVRNLRNTAQRAAAALASA